MTKLPTDQYENISLDDLNIEEEVIQTMPSEKFGCTSRSVEFRKISLTKKDGSKMPDAYNRLVQNGSLNDYFICTTESAWFAAPGGACN